MSTIEATVSMMELMSEEARLKVLEYARTLFVPKRSTSPVAALTEKQLLLDLDQSEKEISEGKYRPMEDVLDAMEKRYGFV